MLSVSDPFDPYAEPHKLMYARVAEHLVSRIETGDLRPGQKLPPERDLAAEYGVAYHTVRKAMEIIRARRMVASVHGRGTFVLPREEWIATPEAGHDDAPSPGDG